MNSRQLHIATVAAADRFFAARRWRSLQIQQVFALDLGDQPPIAGCVLGSTGRPYGLSLLLGARAIEELLAVSGRRLDAAEVGGTALWFTRKRRQDIEAPFDRALLAARHEGQRAPLFLAETAGEAARPPRRAEFGILLSALQALEVLAERGQLDFVDPLETGLVTTLVVRGIGDPIEVERVERAAPPGVQPAACKLWRTSSSPCRLLLPASTAPESAPQHRRLAVAIPELPIHNASDEVRALIVVDIDTGFLATIEVLVGDTLPLARERLLRIVAAACQGAPASCRSVVIVCDQLLEAMVGPDLRAAGIDCRFEPEVPAIEEMLSALADRLS